MAGDRVRDEAERLVAAALAAVSSATRGLGPDGAGLATGSAECCVCPVCRAIAAMRDPSSDLSDRLAAGVGDLATGVAAILRTLSARSGRAESPPRPETSDGDEFWEGLRRKAADAARAYARPSTADDADSTMDDHWRTATRAPEAAEPAAAPETLVPKRRVAKKAVAKKATPAKVSPRVAPQRGATDEGEKRGTRAAGASNRDPARTGGAGTGRTAKKAASPDGAA
jgi:hypothetical protein